MTASLDLLDVSVDYPIYDAGGRSLKNALLRSVGGKIAADHGSVTVKALSRINLGLREGDRLAVIGHNGAGKSTLLRVLAGIYEPSSGDVRRQGTVASLIDIMMGMDPDATGYENILIRGLLLQRKRADILAQVDEIEAFTDLGHYLDLPIRTYSTGMLVRLAFAISTSVVPDILILDEMIGAADSAFTLKAQERIRAYIAASRILVFASHDPSMLRMFCNKAILLKTGSIVAEGDVESVLARYAGGNYSVAS
jgi:ABC-type polysaccharide/polyol phosphate transport system ATPase subunit